MPVDRAFAAVLTRACCVLARLACDQRDRAREATMSHRDTRVRARGNSGGHPGYDLEVDAGGPQRERLLAAAPEHERIPALQTNDGTASLRPRNHHRLG